MSGTRNVWVCRGHELANALYMSARMHKATLTHLLCEKDAQIDIFVSILLKRVQEKLNFLHLVHRLLLLHI